MSATIIASSSASSQLNLGATNVVSFLGIYTNCSEAQGPNRLVLLELTLSCSWTSVSPFSPSITLLGRRAKPWSQDGLLLRAKWSWVILTHGLLVTAHAPFSDKNGNWPWAQGDNFTFLPELRLPVAAVSPVLCFFPYFPSDNILGRRAKS